MTEKSSPTADNTRSTNGTIPAATPPKSALKRCWSAFKLSTRLFIYIPLLILIIVAVLLGTSIGARISVLLANQFVPNLELDIRSGTINKHLEFDYASWSMNGVSVEVEDLSLSWVPTCLFNKQICVDSLTASKVNVRVATDEFDETPEAPEAPEAQSIDAERLNAVNITQDDNQQSVNVQNLDASVIDAALNTDETDEPSPLILPVIIGLNQLDLNNVKVSVNDMRYNAGRLQGKALWNKSGLRVSYLHSQDLLVDIPLGSDETDIDAKSEQNNATDKQDIEEWAMANLPAVYMTFPIYVDELTTTDSVMLLGEREDTFAHIALKGSYVEYLIDIQQLAVTHQYGDAKLIGDISLNDDYPMTIDAQFSLNNVTELPELSNQTLSIQAENGFDDLAVKASASGDINIDFEGTIALSRPEMNYQLEIAKADLQWPLDKPDYFAKIDKLTSKGDINSQSAIFDAELLSPFHPLLDVNANISFESEQLFISSINILSDAGNIKGNGLLNFKDEFSWQAELETETLQLEKISYLYELTELTSNINGQLSSAGTIADETWHIEIADAALDGSLNAFPLTVSGNIELNEQLAVNADNLHATALGAELIINGQANKIWDVDAELTVPDLSQWLPQSTGGIYAKIDVTGDDQQPIVDITGKVFDFEYLDMEVELLNLNAHYLPLSQHQFKLNITNDQFTWQEIDLSQLLINASGNLNQQHLEFSTAGEFAINTIIDNKFDENSQVFDAQIKSLSVTHFLGTWATDRIVEVMWDQKNGQGSVNPFCINHPNNHLCIETPATFGKMGDIQLTAQGTPGLLLKPILPTKFSWTGDSDISVSATWSETEKLQANADINFSEGQLELRRTSKDFINLHYDIIQLTASLNEQVLQAKLIVEAEEIATINSQVTVNTDPSRALKGNINVDALNLSHLQGFFPKLETLEGIFAADLSLEGNLEKPMAKGSISLSKGAIATTSNPTLINDINLAMALKGQKGLLDGSVAMGDGQAQINGTLSWPQGSFSGDIDINGDKLAVIEPPIAILQVSPDINLKFNKEQLAVTGKVDIPTGEIAVVQLAEGGVAVSSDVVFKDSISEQEQRVSPYAIVSDLNINLGPEVSIDGMGLSGKLNGTILLQQQAFKPPLLFGDIRVSRGTYKFMGQTLTISTGDVQFSGPTEVPNLNIEAVREIKEEDLTAGVRVTGTAMRPIVTLFSSPAKEQAEILSYIVTGAGFGSSTNEQNSALMMGAALTLGSQFGGGAINNIGSTATGLIEKFGFSNVQLDANDEGRVAISGYIGEDLMVKYGIGVFNPGYEMTVRYYILSQLYLETVSGTLNQSLDIYYSFNVD
ncbi:translocation/assembly module TamB domain-containing protein [Shewanella sp. 1_MG-2023]|uniref:translocation/assembly module TamB domain-containing protein n=1 Tax=unclassified Shewanella TaxID=196818 RepID=UPI0026E35B93|nr:MULTISPECIES: translocation/assembly module TamB domain-containing protein [unclassified Shewanella]MDO6613279.1 translocation/assembly module TamB domain-containing protein [Shewanella sp. 7_MG-2023]MDO6773215.1 translocation/assembly module TamB domain-containing protein [Shewanella sp. 2_MG-2023]MDO6796610.1 translocation/assembly module TamB domain-containing protein [Shewanella sp. 1_MG-2023]